MQAVSRQRIGKHVSAVTNMSTIIDILLETVFYTRSVQSGYKEDNWEERVGCHFSVDRELVESM
jgi:sarcosine oxidase delta subunit